MRFIVCLVVFGGLFSSSAFANNFKLFCSSGGFLYNYLEVQSDQKNISFHAYGYPWGFSIDKDKLEIAGDMSISDIRFSVDKNDCEFSGGEQPTVDCSSSAVVLHFEDEHGNTLEKEVTSFSIDLIEQRLLIKKGEDPVITQRLRSCVDLTGLE